MLSAFYACSVKQPFFSFSGDHLLIYFIEVWEFGTMKIIADVPELRGCRFSLGLSRVSCGISESYRKSPWFHMSVLCGGLKLGKEWRLCAVYLFQFNVFNVSGNAFMFV